jgi:hypothetical protein
MNSPSSMPKGECRLLNEPSPNATVSPGINPEVPLPSGFSNRWLGAYLICRSADSARRPCPTAAVISIYLYYACRKGNRYLKPQQPEPAAPGSLDNAQRRGSHYPGLVEPQSTIPDAGTYLASNWATAHSTDFWTHSDQCESERSQLVPKLR